MSNALKAILEYNRISDEFDIEIIKSKAESVENFVSEDVTRAFLEKVSAAERVIVHTDYDADGVMSAAISSLYFSEATIVSPERVDGYGLNERFISSLVGGDLLITADCGISAKREIDALPFGVDAIVTDHHTPNLDNVPGCMVINPLLVPGAFGGYSGSSVIMIVLENAFGSRSEAMQYAAIGTVCDIMPMTGPNRAIVRNGLELIGTKPTRPIKSLCKELGVNTQFINEEDIGWKIGPAINAAGRMGDARSAIDLFCGYGELDNLSASLVQYNQERRKVSESFVDSIRDQNVLLNSDLIIIALVDDIPVGFAGLVASALVKKHNKSAMVLGNGETLSGSLRSSGSLNCVHLLNHCSRHLIRYGGHRGAAGVSLRKESLKEFVDCVNSVETVKVDKKQSGALVESVEAAAAMTEEINSYGPFGPGFERPQFVSYARIENLKRIGSDKSHISFTAEGVRCVAFGNDGSSVKNGGVHEIEYTPKLNRFLNRTNIQLEVRRIREL
jgi:single-stranded-DNA-specific exonuclease